MKRRIKNLIGFTIGGSDGEIGKVTDFYFDDAEWKIRYLIVETGNWLSGRKVLLSPLAVINTDWENKQFQFNLTTEQIKNSPDVDTDKPVSRQHEINLYGYYPWGGFYWGGGMGMDMNNAIPLENDVPNHVSTNDDPHLRSANKVFDYSIKASDGDIGEVEDFIINDTNWDIDFMIVDTGNWFPGKKVLLTPKMITAINWEFSTVTVSVTEDQVKQSPEYQPDEELSETYESNLNNYYGGITK